jgi:cellulose biosynthesis protein BcsQ
MIAAFINQQGGAGNTTLALHRGSASGREGSKAGHALAALRRCVALTDTLRARLARECPDHSGTAP